MFGLFGGLANLFSGLIEIFTAVFQSRQVAPAVAPGNVAGAAAGGGAAAQAPVYGDMEEPAEDVAAFMLRAGVRRIIVGHQPRGDAALILEKNGVQVGIQSTSLIHYCQLMSFVFLLFSLLFDCFLFSRRSCSCSFECVDDDNVGCGVHDVDRVDGDVLQQPTDN